MADRAVPSGAGRAGPRPAGGTGGLGRDGLVACVAAATAAPSLHNSQPWRFRCRDGGVDVYADRRRQLPFIDPVGRGLLMSVGAAILNLRLAMLHRSWAPATQIFPDPHDPDLIARIRPDRPVRPDAEVSALVRAIPRRHTNRLPFAPVVAPPAILDQLAAAARVEGARLRLPGPLARATVLGLLEAAEQRLRARGIYRAETTTRIRDPQLRPAILPHTFGPWEMLEAVPLRDFGLRQPELHSRTGADLPTIAVLSTAEDGTAQWVASGQALQRVLLLATVHGLAVALSSQPLEEPELREVLAEPGGAGRWPQLILQVGYAPPNVPAPRRSLSEVLIG